ncbi:hypothetical protein ACFL02_06075, partial [Planctomycetota bacterium]
SPFKFFFAVMVVIMVLMIIAERRRSKRLKQIYIPVNAGVLDLSTCGDYLGAICQGNKIYLWSWEDLSIDPLEGITPSLPAVVLDSNRVISGGTGAVNSVKVSHLRDQRIIREIPLGFSSELISIAVNRERSVLTVLWRGSSIKEPSQKIYQLTRIDPDEGQADPIITIDKDAGDFQLLHVAISDDGRWAALLGGQDKEGLIILVDMSAKKIKWEKTIPGPQQFDKGDFGPKGSWFFAGGEVAMGEDLVLYKIQTDSGGILKQIIADKDIVRIVNTTTFYDLAVSGDGRRVAAITSTRKGGVWDCESGEKIIKGIASAKIASNVAFGPNSCLLAISGLQTGGKIQIIRLY